MIINYHIGCPGKVSQSTKHLDETEESTSTGGGRVRQKSVVINLGLTPGLTKVLCCISMTNALNKVIQTSLHKMLALFIT